MKTIRTYEDGWDCIPQLKEVSEILDDARHEKYEIDNCVRQTELEDLVINLKEKLEEAIYILDKINLDVEIIQKER